MSKKIIIGANSFLSRAISLSLQAIEQEHEGLIHKNKDKLFDDIVYHNWEQLPKLNDEYETVYLISAHVPQKIDVTTQQKLFDTNVKLVEQVVQQFKGAKIVYASSVSIYGEQDKVLHEEDLVSNPNTYGLSKYWGEQIVQTANSYAIARISSMYGVGMNSSTFLPRMITQAVTQKELTVWGDGARQQNYIWVNDVAQYLLAAEKCAKNGIYLAVDTVSYSNLEVAQMIQQYCDCSIRFFGKDNSSSYHYNNKKTQEQLRFQPTQKLEYHIEELVKWIKKTY